MNDHKSGEEVSALTKEASEWIKILYKEGWKQYTHEDNLGQARMKFFLGVQAAILTFSAALSPRVYGVGEKFVFGYLLNIGLVGLGFFWITIGVFSLVILKNWHSVTAAGKQYVEFRRIQLQCLEGLAGIQQMGLAKQESEWLEKRETYVLFPDIELLKHHSVKPIVSGTGWIDMEKTFRNLRIMWFLISLAATMVVILGVLPLCDGTRVARLIKDPRPLYEALRSQKLFLHLDDTDERKRISRILDAASGKSDDVFKIAAMYEKGEGLPRDQVEALQWYEKAAAIGHDIAYSRAARLSNDLFSAEAIRNKVLVAFYVIDARRRLIKATYSLLDRGTALTKGGAADMSSSVPSVPGSYKIITCINPDKRIEESDTRNNCDEVEFKVLPKKSGKQQSE